MAQDDGRQLRWRFPPDLWRIVRAIGTMLLLSACGATSSEGPADDTSGVAATGLTAGPTGTSTGDTGVSAGRDDVRLGPEVSCDAPASTFRLTEVAASRGLTIPADDITQDAPCARIPGGLVAEDLDGDGDVDLVVARQREAPRVWLNDGRGHFTPGPALDVSGFDGRQLLGFGAADLDGDGLPELSVSGEGIAGYLPNTGSGFGEAVVVYRTAAYPRACHYTHAWADLGGDGDLDLLLPGADAVPRRTWSWSDAWSERPQWVGSRHVLVEADDGWAPRVLDPAQVPTLALFGMFTDRDGDGDLDILVGTDRPTYMPPPTFHRNDGRDEGGIAFVEDGAEVGLPEDIAPMGGFAHDLNGDGVLDYCMSDEGPRLACLWSDGGTWFDASAALSLTNAWDDHPDKPDDTTAYALGQAWTTWSIERVDLDHDGWPDIVAAAGELPGPRGPWTFLGADALWTGGPRGYRIASERLGVWSTAAHYGLAVADLAGDGRPDVILAGPQGVELWDAPCTDRAWVTLELEGPASARDGFGARLDVRWGDRREVMELHGLRAFGQSPSVFHLGLGDAETLDGLTLTWPDGTVTTAEALPVRRTVTLVHPARRADAP